MRGEGMMARLQDAIRILSASGGAHGSLLNGRLVRPRSHELGRVPARFLFALTVWHRVGIRSPKLVPTTPCRHCAGEAASAHHSRFPGLRGGVNDDPDAPPWLKPRVC